MSFLIILWCFLAVMVTSAPAQQTGRRARVPAPQSLVQEATGRTSAVRIARLKYAGGGDWYNDPSAEVNLLAYVRLHTQIDVEPTYEYVDLASDNIFVYPVLFMTGHGTVNFSPSDARRLRAYLENGGFLYIDDDYGMDASLRKELKKVFPEQNLVELPFDHPIYSSHFSFSNGLPKIHEHDNKPPQGFGLFSNGRLCVFYTVETNPSDGWADPEVHNNPPDKREAALKIGTNILVYALRN
ncbi:MAG: DUF4159 domain-containing protein [Candidatus Kapabacteria bacterium]|jgi:hypothetical protein|nr:DUF4159 domain-containing protein [Candidatus Kapabacteria bacterium]